ncbi:reverse transcriptase domain-containing protein [Tanacetum coccineum]
MSKKDEYKMAFHTDEGVFCYTKMPFGLKNIRAAYQRLVDTIFKYQIGRNIEAYVDDMVIKIKTEQDSIQVVEETLLTLKKVNMKLNPKKCSFRMEEGKFLGYIVTSEGIRAIPEKTKVVMSMPSPSNLKQMQSLNFRWTEATEEDFQAMKRMIEELPMLTAPIKDEELKVYLSEVDEAVSAVLLVERNRRNSLGLGGCSGIVKNQEGASKPRPMAVADVWKLYTGGASNDYRSGAGLILIDPECVEYSYTLRLNFSYWNNDDEYEALLVGLRIATRMKVKNICTFVDSKLVASQVEGSYEAHGEKTKKYKEKVLEVVTSFNNFQISHIPMEQNKKADTLSKLEAVQCKGPTNGMLVEELNEHSVDVAEVNMVAEEEGRTWMTPIREYMEKGTLLDDPTEAGLIREKINNYVIEDGVLYRKSYLLEMVI